MGRRIEVLDWLRGFAALSVCWFHFTSGSGLFGGWLLASGHYGYLGVEAFFVISGFVIPYAMLNGGYRGVQDAGTFILKRLTRLEPPYLVSLALTLGLLFASSHAPWFKGQPPDFSAARILLHLGYLTVFFGRDWYNPVYWTLAVEFQFYLAMILLFPALAHQRMAVRLGAILVMAGLAFASRDAGILLPCLGLFASGAAAFQYRAEMLPKWPFVGIVLCLAAVNAASLGVPEAVVGLIASGLAAFANPPRVPALAFLGSISYSLYLLHVPIGGRVMNLAGRLPAAWHGPALVVALAMSLVAAWVMWWLVEQPSQGLSARIAYRDKRAALVTVAAGRA